MPQQDMKSSDRSHRMTQLYTIAGQRVAEVKVPRDLQPGIITWGGRAFVYRHGAYSEATVFEAAVGG